MLDTPCSEVVCRVLATHSLRQFSLYFPSLRHRVPSHFNWGLLTIQLYFIAVFTFQSWSTLNKDVAVSSDKYSCTKTTSGQLTQIQICPLLGYYTQYSCNYLQTFGTTYRPHFQGSIQPRKRSSILDFFTLEVATGKFSRNIIITIIIYMSWSWTTCSPVPVSRIQKCL